MDMILPVINLFLETWKSTLYKPSSPNMAQKGRKKHRKFSHRNFDRKYV